MQKYYFEADFATGIRVKSPERQKIKIIKQKRATNGSSFFV
jgi:hypothetical protein